MVTLRELVFDTYNLLHAGRSSDDSIISYYQVEHWIIETRNLLIHQTYSKGNNLSEGCINHLFGLHVSPVDISDIPELGILTGCNILRTDLQLPSFVSTDDRELFLSCQPATITSQNFNVITRNRISYLKFNKWNKNMAYCFMRNRYLYIINGQDIEYVTVEGIFEDPRELYIYENGITGKCEYDDQSRFSISEWMTEIIKQMILKNNGIILQSGTDNSEDGTSNKESTNQKQPL